MRPFPSRFLRVNSSLIKTAENQHQRLKAKYGDREDVFQEKSRGRYFLGEPKLRVGQDHRQLQCMGAGGGIMSMDEEEARW